MTAKFNAYKDIRGSRIFRNMRDASRQKSYNWEFRNLRGLRSDGMFEDKGVAKGFARLCLNVGLRRLEAALTAKGWSEVRARETVQAKRDLYRAHFTEETRKVCCGGTNGVYFAKWGWTKVIIAHEIAHFLDIAEGEALNEQRAGHGPNWLGWFSFLLVDVVGFTADHLRATQEIAGLRTIAK